MKHVPLDVWRTFNTRVGASFRLGEWLDGDPASVARAWHDGGFTAMFDFPLAFAATDVFCKAGDVRKLGAVLTNDRRMPDPSQLVTLLGNHDLPRVMSLCDNQVDEVKAAWAFLFTTRGIPSITWGDEVGFNGAKEPENRASMRFEAEHPLRAWLAELSSLRRAHPALQDGASVVLSSASKQLVMGRAHAEELALVAIGETTLPKLPKQWAAYAWKRLKLDTSRVAVWVATTKPGDALPREVDVQWRTGAKTKRVHFDGAAGEFLVGSGAELGDWNPKRGVALPADVTLPVGGVFAFKRVRFDGATPVWPQTADEVISVDDDER